MGTQSSLLRPLNPLFMSADGKEEEQRLGAQDKATIKKAAVLLLAPGKDVVGTEGLLLPA